LPRLSHAVGVSNVLKYEAAKVDFPCAACPSIRINRLSLFSSRRSIRRERCNILGKHGGVILEMFIGVFIDQKRIDTYSLG
jgi:hypothetical protein